MTGPARQDDAAPSPPAPETGVRGGLRWVYDVFSFLTLTSARNRARRQLTRLRNPRYAIALVFGVLYIWFFLFRQPSQVGPASAFLSEDTVERWASLWLFVLFTYWWLFGKDRSALAFTPAEVQFLFAAPISRRQLIQYKLLRGQLTILVSTLIWVYFLRRGGLMLSPFLRALSLWSLFSFFTLHRLGATLVRTAAAEHGTAGLKRNIPAIMVFGAIAGGLAWSLVGIIPELRSTVDPPQALRAIDRLLDEPVPRALLLPFRLVLAPTFATSAAEWLRTFPIAVAILALNYLWVVRSEAAFEDAAVEASVARAKRLEAFRARRAGAPRPVRAGKRTWLRLAQTGHPGGAIVWKNLIGISRSSGSPTLAIVGITVMAIVVATVGTGSGLSATIGTFALVFTALSVVAGSRFVRNDLRQDLLNIRLLRTYPLSGTTIVGAEVASATIVLTVVQVGLLLLAYAAFRAVPRGEVDIPMQELMLAAAPLVLLVINSATVTIQNAAALLFPAWVHLGMERTAGIEALGQNILTTLASLLIFALGLVPPAIAGWLAFIGARWAVPDAPALPWAAAALASVVTLALEVSMAVVMLGDVFESGDAQTQSA